MKLDLKEIVQSLKANDNTCLKVFFLEYSDYCTKTLIQKTNCSTEDADDIFVDAIINLRERLLDGKIEFLTNAKAYLYSTCYNMWLVKYRKQKIHESHAKDILEFYDDPALPHEEKEALFDLVSQAISSLGDKCQRIIKLFYLSKLNMTEIAEDMGFSSPGVAKTTKSRCYKKLMEAVKNLMNEKQVYLS